MNSRLVEMIARGRLPFRGGQWIDAYNQTTDPDCAGTIIAGINAKNHYFIMEEAKHETHTGQIRDDKPEPVVLGWTRDKKGNVIDRHPVDVANAVTAAKRDNTQDYVVIPANTADGQQTMELGGVCDLSYPNSKTRRGRVQDRGTVAPTLTCNTENSLRRIEAINSQDGCSRTIKRQYQQTSRANLTRQGAFGATGETDGYRIRKLTPRECFRLMGVSDADIDKIQAAGISKSQQYKMAGNSIVVNTLAAIFRQLLIGNFNKVIRTEIF